MTRRRRPPPPGGLPPHTIAEHRDKQFAADAAESIERMAEALRDIEANWTEGRNLSRLHPGMTWQEYVRVTTRDPEAPA